MGQTKEAKIARAKSKELAQKRLDKRKAAQALRAIPSEKRAEQSRENGKKGGRPRKDIINFDSLIQDGRCRSCGAEMSVEEARASGHAHLDD